MRYCERKLEPIPFGKVEQDVEHFRPKGSVKAWKAPKPLRDQGIPFATVPNQKKGYYLLPYHPFNYAAACKPCNSTLKKDFFPIAGTYNLDAEAPQDLASEKAYLIYPIGSLDEDPARLIEFRGASPRPVAQSGHKRNRALVTIEFFKLDDPVERNHLIKERARLIELLYARLKKTKTGTAAQKAAARRVVDGFLRPALPHLNCARSFKRLFDSNPAEAEAVYDEAVKLVNSVS